MKFGFSSLGAPERTFANVVELARACGLDFVELRSLENTCDLPRLFEGKSNPAPIFPVRLLGSSLRLITAEEEDIKDFVAFAKLTDALNSPFVRVFGGGAFGDTLTDDKLDQAAKTVQACREQIHRLNLHCRPLLETHSGFSTSESCERLNERLNEPIEILWDSHHTWRLAREFPLDTWRRLGPWVRHVHYKDSVNDSSGKEGYRYVLPGTGKFPTAELFTCLRNANYSHGVSLEWEKLWHPELPVIEEALSAFLAVKNQQLSH